MVKKCIGWLLPAPFNNTSNHSFCSLSLYVSSFCLARTISAGPAELNFDIVLNSSKYDLLVTKQSYSYRDGFTQDFLFYLKRQLIFKVENFSQYYWYSNNFITSFIDEDKYNCPLKVITGCFGTFLKLKEIFFNFAIFFIWIQM